MTTLLPEYPKYLDAALRPCPFCGHPARLKAYDDRTFSVGCRAAFDLDLMDTCQFRPVAVGLAHKLQAIAAWNAQR